MQDIWNTIKTFFVNHIQHSWLERHLLYLFLIGLFITVVLGIIYLIKTYKDIKKMDKEKRKQDKKILRLLSDKRNKLDY